jgi:hypothetical protein
MHTIMKVVFALALLIGVEMPAAADAFPTGLQPMVTTNPTGRLMTVSSNSSVRNISLFNKERRIQFNPGSLNLGYVAVVVGSGAAVGIVSDMIFDGGMFTMLSVLAGAALGGEWYQQNKAAAADRMLNASREKWTHIPVAPFGQTLAGN